ncbi:MAG: ABC transporter ATP-binding protein [Dehalococcoidales bacterium]|jgi:iron complex transport system ATP-binding protein|nr:ABC transporter ATP-binding protein [Dehalococcoidales bacterium]
MTKLEMQNVTLGYKHKVVAKDITLQVKSEEIVGLVGPNGCGKSTIIRALSRVISPYSGRILLNEKNISTISRRDLSRLLGVIPQTPRLPSTFTAFEVVLMGRNPHLGLFQHESPKDMDIAWRAMGKTRVQPLAQQKIGELSGGEVQCVAIARVLAQKTKVVLLDEPTANLDIGRQTEILDVIKDMCQENGLIVIAALHDLNLAAQYCNRLILINNGRIHALGTPTEVITNDNIKEVYGAGSYICNHPLNGLPVVLPNAGNSK